VKAMVKPLSLGTSYVTVGGTTGKACGQLDSPVYMNLDNKRRFPFFAQLNVEDAIMEIPPIGLFTSWDKMSWQAFL
jgi:hypothetical protein